MRCRYLYFFLFFSVGLLCSCGEDDEPYPSILTELADVRANEDGVLCQFTTDSEKTFPIANPLTGYQANSIYRCVCGYVVEENMARLYQLSGVYVLRDSAECACQDPVSVVSVWRAGHYVNMQLFPKTQGGTQYWGFCNDSISDGKAFLSLHHRQNDDPLSYSTTVYASIPVDSLECDSILLSIRTFNGVKTYNLKR